MCCSFVASYVASYIAMYTFVTQSFSCIVVPIFII